MNRQPIDRGIFSVTLSLATLCGCGPDASGPSAPDEQAVQGDESVTAASQSANLPYFTRTLPDNTFMVCPLPWAVTGYGRVGQCTAKITGPWGTFGRVGFYNRDFDRFEPASDWRPLTDQHYEEIPDGDGYLLTWGTLVTDFGPVRFATKYKRFSEASTRHANWGNYNLSVRRYFPANNDWWPVASD